MKRASIAEITLQKQVKAIECQLEVLYQSSRDIAVKAESVRSIKSQLEDEIRHLRKQREAASDRANHKSG